MDHSFVVTLKEGEWATIYNIGDVTSDGQIDIEYRYHGELQTEEVERLLGTAINKFLEDILLKEPDNG